MSAFLRWAGSKRKLLSTLTDVIPQSFDRYIEPFAGSACLFFELQPKKAILGDINEELTNTYYELKADAEAVIRSLSRFRPNEQEYYRIRSLDPSKLLGPRRAARFIYLNRFCFNGLYRTNKNGQFNVPYGAYRSGALPSSDTLRSSAASLKKTIIITGSFEKTLQKVKSGDFVYLDPPYCIRARRVFNEYSHFNFGSEELKRLRFHLQRLNKMGVPFLVSYGVSNEARELAKGFHYREVLVQRQIAGFAAKRRKNKELLITNY